MAASQMLYIGGSYAPATIDVEYFVLGGGGGGVGGYAAWNDGVDREAYCGGGGGAGGLKNSSLTVAKGVPLTVTVGAGGATAVNGSNSVFDSIISPGGGRGGAVFSFGPGGGGQGGGGGAAYYGSPTQYPSEFAAYAQNGGGYPSGAGICCPGNFGGSGYSDPPNYVSGGMGGGLGSNGFGGGNGATYSFTGSSVTYGGGGGGGNSRYGTQPGGSGGGGAGGCAYDPVQPSYPGAGNTGSGGGGNGGFVLSYYGFADWGSGSSGGSGLVSIRYPSSLPAAAATTGSPSVLVTGGYRIYTWTGSGSITF